MPDAQCLVCLKAVRDQEGIAHFKFDTRWVTICCPLCFEAFEADPQSYLGRKLPPRESNPSL